MTQMTGRRDRKKTDTRQALRAAAVRLSLERGYDKVTIEEITEVADVSVRTFFNYFESKEAAVFGMERDGAARVADALAARPAGESPVVSLRAVFIEMADDIAERHVVWQQRAELLRTNPQLWPRMMAAFAEFERGITEAVAKRTGLDAHHSLYPSVVTSAAVGAMRAAIHHWGPPRDADGLRDLLAEAFDVLVRGAEPPVAKKKKRVVTC